MGFSRGQATAPLQGLNPIKCDKDLQEMGGEASWGHLMTTTATLWPG